MLLLVLCYYALTANGTALLHRMPAQHATDDLITPVDPPLSD